MLTEPAADVSTRSYRQRGAETRRRRTTAAVVAAAEQVLLNQLINHPTEPLSRVTLAQICEEGEIIKATMSRRFRTIEAVCAAVAEKMITEGREVPGQIADLAERHLRDEAWKKDVTPANVDLVARIGSKGAGTAELTQGYERARSRNDRTEVIYWCAELAEKYFRDSRREDLSAVEKSLDAAYRGLKSVDPKNDVHCMLGFRLTQAGARAELLLSTRRPEYEATGLTRIQMLKNREIRFATTLGWELKAELARFHRDRSTALCLDMVEPEIISVRDITETILKMCEPVERHTSYEVSNSRIRPPQDSIPAEELSGVISRLCAVEMAYAKSEEYSEYFEAAFPKGIRQLKRDLLECFQSASGDEVRQEESDIRALIRLQELDVRLHEAGSDQTELARALKEYEQAPVDLLRSARFGIIRHVLVARYLTAKAKHQRLNEIAAKEETSRSPVYTSSDELIAFAVHFYAHAEEVTRRRGAGGKLRAQAQKEREELISEYQVPESEELASISSTEFKDYLSAVNDLVMRAFTWRARLSSEQISTLYNILNPVERYLQRSHK